MFRHHIQGASKHHLVAVLAPCLKSMLEHFYSLAIIINIITTACTDTYIKISRHTETTYTAR